LSACRIGNKLGTHWERALEPLRTFWEIMWNTWEQNHPQDSFLPTSL
jgi:hypothetical protein